MTLTQKQKDNLFDSAPGLLLLVGQLMQRLDETEVTMDPDELDEKAMGELAIRRSGAVLQVRRVIK